jgi:processive 1,2-diacylglycerol beta-glucosyltransferase
MILKPMIDAGELKAKTFGILTDFTLHPYWEDVTHLNYIIIPCKELADQLLERGFKPEQILPIGVPIQKKFSEIIDKKVARAQLGLLPDQPVVTVMSGSMCFGGVTNTVKSLDAIDECFQIIAVCGSSKKELEKLNASEFRHKVLKLGFTENINVIMDASDCIITKPGGLSTSEALSRKLPMILTKAIPGHEERNLKFLCESGAALAVTENDTADKLLKRFLSDEKLKTSMCEAAEKIGRFRAAEALYEFICNKKD